MNITEVTNGELYVMPDNKGLKSFGTIMKHPITPEEAQVYILPIINTPMLGQLLKSLDRDDHLCDARPHIIDYLKAELPSIAQSFMKLGMLRDENAEGTLSPLGHKDEEDD